MELLITQPNAAKHSRTKFEMPSDMKANLEASRNPTMFEPENKHHRQAFAHFLENGKWPNGIRFAVEWPHTSAVTTIQTKLCNYALRKELAAIRETKETIAKAAA